MSVEIEDAIVSAAHAAGLSINSTVMQTVAVDLAGSSLAGNMITIPGKGTIAVRDYLADLRARAPSGFSKAQQQPDGERTVFQLRRKRPLDAAWHQRRAKASGITRSHMDEIARNRA